VVTVITGEFNAYFHALKTSTTAVDINGKPVLYGDRDYAGYYQNRACKVKVDDGKMVLRFWGNGDGPFYFNNCEWMINGLLIQQVGDELTPAAERYLADAQLRSKAAIRNWYVLGPFDDDDCTGLERDFGPEYSTDLKAVYHGKNGEVKWHKADELKGDAPYLSFEFEDKDEVAGFAMARVYSNKSQEAVLTASTTQLAVGYVNGKEVFRDETMAGLLPHEERVPVELKKGWNTILIKSMNHFGDEWALWAGLETLDGKSLKDTAGVVISASSE